MEIGEGNSLLRKCVIKALSRRSATIEVGNWDLNIEKYNLLNVKLMSICTLYSTLDHGTSVAKKNKTLLLFF